MKHVRVRLLALVALALAPSASPAQAPAAPAPGAPAPAAPAPAAPAATTPAPAAPAAATAAPAVAPAAPESPNVTVIINTQPPSSANVYWGRKLLGKITPTKALVLSRPRDSGPLDIMVRPQGFLAVQTRAHTFSDNRVIVKLTLPENIGTLLGYKAPQPVTESPEQAAAINALSPLDPSAPPPMLSPLETPLDPPAPMLAPLAPAPPAPLAPAPPPAPSP